MNFHETCPICKLHYGRAVGWSENLGVPVHSVPESLYSFRFRLSRISVFYNRKFIPNPLRFHEKKI